MLSKVSRNSQLEQPESLYDMESKFDGINIIYLGLCLRIEVKDDLIP